MAQNNFVDFDQAKALANKIAQRFNEQSAGLIFKGSKTFATLPSTLTQAMAGYFYNMSESFTTDSRFVEGSGKTYPAGTNVSVADCSTYEAVVDPSGDPSLQGWYELVNNKYVLSADTEVDPSKTYYVGTISMKFDVASGFIDVESINDRIDDVRDDVAEQFSTSETYKAGDIVMHNDLLYKFKTDHSAGAWNSAEVDATNIAGELSENQNVLTAGDYIEIDGNEISVNPVVPNEEATYQIVSDGQEGGTYFVRINKIVDGEVVLTERYSTVDNVKRTFDDTIRIDYANTVSWNFTYELLVASTTHDAGYTYSWGYSAQVDIDEVVVTADHSGENLVLKAQMDTALATKQDALTFDDTPTTNSNNPVKSGGVKSAIDAAISSAYHHAGTKTCAELVAGLLVAANEGNVYNMTDSGTTTADFIEGAGQPIKAGDNVGIAKISDGVYKFDLLSGFVDTSNFVQKSVTAGLLKNDGTVDTTIHGDVSSLKSGLTNIDNEVNGDATTYPYADVITIEDAIPANVADCKVKIEPVQDLHGQSAPWVGGAGKNKLPMTVDWIKALNVYGTWSGNAYAYNGVTFTILTDNDGNVTGVSATGTASDSANFIVATSSTTGIVDLLNGKSMIYNGCPSGGSVETYSLYGYHVTTSGGSVRDTGNGVTFDGIYSGPFNFSISVASGYTIPTGGLTFYPMIRLATETDATFAPYTNYCPITGHTEASVQRDGKNLCSELESGTLNEYGLNTDRSDRVRTKYYIRVVEGQQYVVSALPSVSGKVVNIAFNGFAKDDYATYRIYDSGWLTSGSYITIPSRVKFVRCVFRYETNENITPSSLEDVQLELGSTATPYVPYAGKTYTIALGDTIYGGTVDFDSGVMTVTHGFAEFDGSVDEGWTVVDSNRRARSAALASVVKKPSSSAVVIDAISNMFKTVSAEDTYSGNTGFAIDASGILTVADGTGSMNAESFTNLLGSQHLYIAYPLATPTTIQLTPQQIQLLKGTNTLTASTGQISVTVNGVSGAIGAVQEQVNELAEDVANLQSKQMVKTSETVTLNANGVSRLTLTFSNGRLIYAVVISTTATYLALPYITSDKTWAVKVVDPTDMSPIASEEVEIGYGYIPN